MKNQNFDKYFENNANERSFDFDESFWNEMETLIDEQDDSKPAAPFNWKKLWIAGVFCFGIGATIMFFRLQSTNEVNHISDEKNISSSINQEETTSNTVLLKKKQPNSNKEKETTEKSNNKPVAIISTIDNNKVLQNATPKTIKVTKSTDKKISNNTSNSVSNNSTTPQKANNVPNQPNDQKVVGKEKPLKHIAVVGDAKDDDDKIIGESSGQGIEDDKAIITKNKTTNTELNVIEEWVYLTSDINPLVVEIVQLKPFPLFEPVKENGENEIKPARIFELGVVAGSHFYQGYKNIGDKGVPLSNDYFGGIYIKTALNQKWSGKIGVNYWQRDALNSVINADSTVYSFGATVYSKTVNIHQTQSIELPISVAYHLKKSSLTAGLQVSYLLNAKGTYQETVSDAFSTINRAEITQNGYQSAFNRLDFGMSLGYEYQVSEFLSLGGQAQVGFLDVTNNDIFKNVVTDRNTMLKVYATYDFWKIKK
jgi:hypothetical protein